MRPSFEEKLAFGRDAELAVSQWLKQRGNYVIPSYDYQGAENKAPRMSGLNAAHVVPDLDVAKDGNRFWIEVKRFNDSPINRKLGERVHGLKDRLYREYLSIQMITGCPVFLIVVENFGGGQILAARLDSLTPHGCMCGPCSKGITGCCRAPIKCCVYFRRSAFEIVGESADLGLEASP